MASDDSSSEAWTGVYGTIAGSGAAARTKKLRWEAEVDRAEERLRLRRIGSAPLVTLTGPPEDGEPQERHVMPPGYQGIRRRALAYNSGSPYHRHSPVPVCACIDSEGKSRKVYFPWVAENHVNCEEDAKRARRRRERLDVERDAYKTLDDNERFQSLQKQCSMKTIEAPPEVEQYTVTYPNEAPFNTESDHPDRLPPHEKLHGRFELAGDVTIECLYERIHNEFRPDGGVAFNFYGSRMLEKEDHPLIPIYSQRCEAILAAGGLAPKELPKEWFKWSIGNVVREKHLNYAVHQENGTHIQYGWPGGITEKDRIIGYSGAHWSTWGDGSIKTSELTIMKNGIDEAGEPIKMMCMANTSDGLGPRSNIFLQGNNELANTHDPIHDHKRIKHFPPPEHRIIVDETRNPLEGNAIASDSTDGLSGMLRRCAKSSTELLTTAQSFSRPDEEFLHKSEPKKKFGWTQRLPFMGGKKKATEVKMSESMLTSKLHKAGITADPPKLTAAQKAGLEITQALQRSRANMPKTESMHTLPDSLPSSMHTISEPPSTASSPPNIYNREPMPPRPDSPG